MSREDFLKQSLQEWATMINTLRPERSTLSVEWREHFRIVSILNKVGEKENTNHMFFPRSGGLQLSGATMSVESGCIELHTGTLVHIVRPDSLSLETFPSLDQEHLWSYFRLETLALAPSGVYEDLSSDHEELVEIARCKYVERWHWDAGYYGYDEFGQAVPLPKTARAVIRYFGGGFAGALVIVAKFSPYNQDTSTYDGRHSKMDAAAFRQYIEKHIEAVEA